MKALELNGLHIGKQIVVEFRHSNADGTFRANARTHQWYIVPRTLMHKENGNVKITGMYSKSLIQKQKNGRYSGYWYNPSTIPADIPYHAEVLVLDA